VDLAGRPNSSADEQSRPSPYPANIPLLSLAPRHTLEEQSAAERRIQAELQRERLKG
jgi:hypothetical protein